MNKLAKGPGVLKNEDPGNQADCEEAEAVLQSIKGSSTGREARRSSTDKEMDRMGRLWIEGKAQKGKDGYTQLCN